MVWWVRGCVLGFCGVFVFNSAGVRVRVEFFQKARMLGVGYSGEGRGQQRVGGEVGFLWYFFQCGRGVVGCFFITEVSSIGEGWGRSFFEGQGSVGFQDFVLQFILKLVQGDVV